MGAWVAIRMDTVFEVCIFIHILPRNIIIIQIVIIIDFNSFILIESNSARIHAIVIH